MLVRDAEGRLIVAASAGMDDATVQSLNDVGRGWSWRRNAGAAVGVRRGEGGLGVRVGGKSFAVVLGREARRQEYERGDRDSAVDGGRADAGGAGGGCGWR